MSYTGAPNPKNQPAIPVTVGASPFTWQNTNPYAVNVLMSGGLLSLIEYSRDGTSYSPAGAGPTIVPLNPGDYVRITYTLIPSSMVAIPTR